MSRKFITGALVAFLLISNQRIFAQSKPIVFTEDSLLSFVDDRFYSFTGSMFPDLKSKVMFQISVTRKNTSQWNLNNNYSLFKLYFRDSLLNLINNSKDPIEKAKTYGELTNLNPYDSIDFYYTAARHLVDSFVLNSNNEEVHKARINQIGILSMFAHYYDINENYLKSFQLIHECLMLSENVVDSGNLQMEQIWMHLPKLYQFDQEEFFSQVEKYKKLTQKYNKDGDLKNLYMRIGTVYNQAMNFIGAKDYYLQALNIIKGSNVESEMPGGISYDIINSKLSDIYYSLGQYDSSIYFIRNTIKSNQAGSEIPESFIRKDNGYAYNRIGTCYLMMSMMDSSLHYFRLASEYEYLFPNLFYAGYTANGLGNHVLANEYLTRALDVQNKSGARIFSEPDSMEVAKVYSEFYASRNDYRAAYLAYQQFSPKFNPNPIIKQNEVNARRASYNIYKYQQQKLINELENKLHIESEQKQETIFIVLLVSAGGAFVIFGLAFISIRNKRKRDVAELSEQITSVEMKSLRSQMNPHFIFNSLQSIQNFLINNKSEDANEYLLKFSKLMRLVLENSQMQDVTLKDDILTLELYMQLEKLRFTKPFEYEIVVEASVDIDADTIPPLILQPFVENAIWHGLQYKTDPGNILIRFKKENDMLICVVEDNGVGRSNMQKSKNLVMKKESLGMKLTAERISLLQKVKGVKATLRVVDLFNEKNMPEGTRVEVLLPLAG